MTTDPMAPDHATWGARFGWLVGAVLGIVAGFVLTYALERGLHHTHVTDPLGVAGKLSSVIVPATFIAGALGGHAFGARGGMARYRVLGIAAGTLIAALGWTVMVLTR